MSNTDQVKILVSHGYGAGWFSWNTRHPGCLRDPEIIAAVERGDRDEAERIANAKWPGGRWGGAEGLVVETLPKGTQFRIDEYDGAESIATDQDDCWMTA